MKNKNSEKVIEKYLVDQVALLGGWAIKFIPDQVRGLPDRIVLLPEGKIFFVELKSKGHKLRPIQKSIHKRFELIGFVVLTIDSIEMVDSFITLVKNNQL